MIRRVILGLGLLLASVRVAAAELPSGGVLAATQHNVGVRIVRITPTGIEKVAQPGWGGHAVHDLGFSDATTLWVLVDDSDGDVPIRVDKFVDGKLAAKIELPRDVLPRAYTPDLALMFTTTGAVWVESCRQRDATDRCLDGSYARVDKQPFARATSKPAKVDAHRGAKLTRDGTAAFAPQRAPRGYTAKLVTREVAGQRLAGVSCTGPRGASLEWPTEEEAHMVVSPLTGVTWVMATPPVARVDFKPSATFEIPGVYLLGCREKVEGVASFGRDLWGVYRHRIDESSGRPRSTQSWTVHLGAKELGTIDGVDLRVAPW